MKIVRLSFFGTFLFYSIVSSANNNINIQDPQLKSLSVSLVNQNPKWVEKAKRIVTTDSYGRCLALELFVAIRQAQGRFYDAEFIPAFIIHGEVLNRVRPHILSGGITSSELDAKIKLHIDVDYDIYKNECLAQLKKITDSKS